VYNDPYPSGDIRAPDYINVGDETMPQYVVELTHTSDQCPTANSKVRERAIKGSAEMPKLAQKLGVTFVAGPLVLGSEHASMAVVEAEKIETVNDFLLQSGLIQWNTVRVVTAKPLEESMKELEKAPPPIY
jgi:hypothetical protein